MGFVACQGPPERLHKVGRTARTFTDESRPNWTNDGPRPLLTTIWYPVDQTAKETEWLLGDSSFFPLFTAGWTAVDAPLTQAAETLPLILLSHGTGGASAQLSWLAEALVIHGAIVAAVNHHGNTAAEKHYLPHGFALWWERAEDLRQVLDALLTDTQFGPRIDAARIGAAGFSLGGYTVLVAAGAFTDVAAWLEFCESPQRSAANCDPPPEAPFSTAQIRQLAETDMGFRQSMERSMQSYRDERIKAVYVIAPPLAPALTAASLEKITIPVHITVGENDTLAPAEENAQVFAQTIPGAQLSILPHVSHYTFLAECRLLGRWLIPQMCHDPAGVDRAQVHHQVAADANTFFDRTL